MSQYVLISQNNKTIKDDSLTFVMKELMKITKETGNIPLVTYDEKERATCFEFEGYYCNFKLFLVEH